MTFAAIAFVHSRYNEEDWKGRAVKERFEIWLAPQNGERREVAPLRQLGWAFLLAWVFCVASHQRRRRAERGRDPGCGRSCS